MTNIKAEDKQIYIWERPKETEEEPQTTDKAYTYEKLIVSP